MKVTAVALSMTLFALSMPAKAGDCTIENIGWELNIPSLSELQSNPINALRYLFRPTADVECQPG